MKCAIFSPFLAKDGQFRGLSKHGGGVAIRYEQFMNTLRAQGHEVEVRSPDLNNVEVMQITSAQDVREFCPTVENVMNYNKVISWCDLVIAPDSAALLVLLPLCVLHGKPLIYNIHTDVVALLRQWDVPAAVAQMWNVALRITGAAATKVYCVSKQQVAQLKDVGVHCDGFYLPVKWSSPDPSDEELTAARDEMMGGGAARRNFEAVGRKVLLLSVGRWNHEKRIKRLCDTLPDHCVLAILGDGPYDCDAFHEPERGIVVSRGLRPRAELAKFYKAADFVVSASDFETFGNVSYEANMCGAPSILHPAGGHCDQILSSSGIDEGLIIDDNGAFVDFDGKDADVKRKFTMAIDAWLERRPSRDAVAAAIKRNIEASGGLEISTAVERTMGVPSSSIVWRVTLFVMLCSSLAVAWAVCWLLVYMKLVKIRLYNSKRPLPYVGFGTPIYVWAPSSALMLAVFLQWASL